MNHIRAALHRRSPQEYEAGKAIPSGAIISKIERALGVHLPRPAKKK
jgi:ribosome-binding protein aMBF1 (putative translation factor)